MSLVFLVFGLFLLFFTAEKKFKEEKHQTFFQIFMLLPKFFTNSRLRTLITYICLTRVCGGFYGEALTLKFLDHGIERTTLVNIGTVLTPVGLVAACLCNRYMKKGMLVQYYHKLKVYEWMMNALSFLSYLYLARTKNIVAVEWSIFILGILTAVSDQAFNFFFGFVNLIIDEELGSSSITVLMSIWNASRDVPNTNGLKMVKWVNFNVFIVSLMAVNLALLIWQWKTAKMIDMTDAKE
jgi:hypothetical protein